MTQGTVTWVGRSEIRTGLEPPDPRESISSTLTAIEAIATRENVEPVCRRLLDLRQRVEQDRFQLAVVGQFQRGKTSVLNALLRNEVLPVGTLPFTSVLTIVKYGDLQSAEVLFQSGERLPISVDELLEYVSEAGNPSNVKNVEHVEVSYPSELLRGGVTFTNCPGFGSPSDRNTQTAYEFLPCVDAAIFVTSPDPPLTSAEMEFLKRLAGSTKKIFLVMNKIDLLDASSLAALLEFTQEAVSRALGTPIPVYVVSAREVLAQISRKRCSGLEEPGFHHLESDLQRFLKEERNDVFYTSILRSLLNSIGDLRIHLQLCIESTAASSQDSDRKRARFEQELTAALQRQQQNEVSLAASIRQLVGLVKSETSRFVESRHPSLDSTLRAHLKDCERMPKGDLAASFDRFIEFQIQHIFNQWRPDFEGSLDHAFREASVKFLQATNDVADSIRDTAFALFGVELSSLHIIEHLPVIPGDHRTNPATQWQHGRPSFLLPGPIFRWRVLKIALQVAPFELDRTGGLLARDLKSRLSELTEAFTDNVRNQLRERVAAVRLALAEALARQGHSEICNSERLRRLSADIDELDQVTEMLRAGAGAEYALEA